MSALPTASWATQPRGEVVGGGSAHLGSRGVIIEIGCASNSKYTIARFCHIEIDLHDTIFAPQQFDEHGEIGLDDIVQRKSTMLKECSIFGLNNSHHYVGRYLGQGIAYRNLQ